MKVIFLLVASICCSLPALAQSNENVSKDCEEATTEGNCLLLGVSMIQLLAAPEQYDGKKVWLVGYIHFEEEGAGIYLHKEDLDQQIYANGLWVSFAEGIASSECQDSYVLIEGVFDAQNTGHMGLWSGAIHDITRCMKWPVR